MSPASAKGYRIVVSRSSAARRLMKIVPQLLLAIFASTCFLHLSKPPSTSAKEFSTAEVNSSQFMAIAAPFGNHSQNYRLVIVEQLYDSYACWIENTINPGQVKPLPQQSNYDGICEIRDSSNDYSIRLDEQDLAPEYEIEIIEDDGDLVLVGKSNNGSVAAPIEIGRTKGIGKGFQKINLNTGWRFTRRILNGRDLGHIYLTGNLTAIETPIPYIAAIAPQPQPEETAIINTPQPQPEEVEITATAPPIVGTKSPSPLPPLEEDRPANTPLPLPLATNPLPIPIPNPVEETPPPDLIFTAPEVGINPSTIRDNNLSPEFIPTAPPISTNSLQPKIPDLEQINLGVESGRGFSVRPLKLPPIGQSPPSINRQINPNPPRDLIFTAPDGQTFDSPVETESPPPDFKIVPGLD